MFEVGLSWWWATVFASVIYAGSLEFLLLGMVLAVMPLASVAMTAFLVNFRHIFYAWRFRFTGSPACRRRPTASSRSAMTHTR
jgi:predicted branched-subunit amino acid permease